jgi:hypothetical protein
LEKFITCPLVSGHRLYVGEGRRPNLLTWFITLNGISLGTDMAQRSVIIKLVRGENSGTWYEETLSLIDEYRSQIIGDIIGALRAPQNSLARYSRWSSWEDQVLRRLPDPDDIQSLILNRQGEANCELEEAANIEDYFARELSRFDYDPLVCKVRIPNDIAAQWYGRTVGKVTGLAPASRRLCQLIREKQMTRLAVDPSHTHGRGYIWKGEKSAVDSQIDNNLEDRLRVSIDSHS